MKPTFKKIPILTLLFLIGSTYFVAAQTHFNRNLPNEAHQQIVKFIGNGISTFAFTPTGGWVVATNDGKSFSRNIPQECHDKINQLIKEGHKIVNVSFPPAGGNKWVIITDKTFFARNIPDECYKKMGQMVKEGKKISKVIFPTKRTTDNSWLILNDNGSFFARNIDDECFQILNNLSQSPYPNQKPIRKIHHVEFAPNGGWLILADDYHVSRNISKECDSQLDLFKTKKNKIALATFTPDGKGWSILSNNKSNTIPIDPIRIFEANVNKTEIVKRMKELDIPGLSVAVVINGKLAWTTSYGFIKSADKKNAVHPKTFFQAASVSKVLAAIGAHKMVDDKLIRLDDDIQKKFTNYTVPVHSCQSKDSIGTINIRNILNHQSGIDGRDILLGDNCKTKQTGGYIGYSTTTLPSLTEILDGKSPANTKEITIAYDNKTDRSTHYSGPAFTVLQKLTEDLTRQTYNNWMRSKILQPLRMDRSNFTTSPEKMYTNNELSWGYNTSTKKQVRNRYPEFAAAGLYTNAFELANVIIMLNNLGKLNNTTILSSAAASLIRRGNGTNTNDVKISATNSFYAHGGSNEGYRAYLIGFPSIANNDEVTSAGIVVMLNADQTNFRYDVANAIIKAYGW